MASDAAREAPWELQIHGSLVEVRGVGVLILGPSGVGKSECVIELVRRGQRLVADDVVRMRLEPDGSLLGWSPEHIRHYIEVRGLGLLCVADLFGREATLDACTVAFVVRLAEPGAGGGGFERIGLERRRERLLGADVPMVELPVQAGSNLATIVDLAIRDWQLRLRGVNAARRLDERLRGLGERSPEGQSDEEGGVKDGVRQRVVFVSGLSGSGKTTAMAALEDLSFYCVDNLPVQLVPQFLALCTKATSPIEKVALALDAREQKFLEHLPQVVANLRRRGSQVDVVFLDCADEVLERRYRETRRVHPLSPGGSVHDGIALERTLLGSVAQVADLVVDTTQLNVHQLKETIIRHVTGSTKPTVVNVISFGFRHGTPSSIELLFDVRFLPNPYFDEILRPGTGLEAAVSDYVLKSERGGAFLERLRGFVTYLLPFYDEEGKAYVTIGIGCTGGRHRSVAMAEAIAAHLREAGRDVSVTHRDVEKAL